MKNRLQNFLDTKGRVVQWPAKQSNQELVLAYLAEKFDSNTTYSEHELNEILKAWHTFGDWAILRRALVDSGYLQRKRDGSAYRRVG